MLHCLVVDVAALQFVGPSTLVYSLTSNNFWLNLIFLLFWIFCLQQSPCISSAPPPPPPSPIYYPLFQWRFGNPFIRWSHTFTPKMSQRLLDISTALNDFFTNSITNRTITKLMTCFSVSAVVTLHNWQFGWFPRAATNMSPFSCEENAESYVL